MQAHATRARLPSRPRPVATQSGEFLPVLSAVGRPEQGRIFHSGVDRIRILERWLEMPHSFELPGMRRAVVPLVSAGNALVRELIAYRLPRFPTVARALNQLPEPAAGLLGVQPIRVSGRSLHVINLPPRKMWAADLPPLTFSVGLQHKRTLACAN